MQDVRALNEMVAKESAFLDDLTHEVGKVIVGQTYMIERILVGLLTGGHVLLEGVPGLAKTLSVRTLCEAIHAKFARVQFTPDLLPADLIGTVIYNHQKGEFSSKLGPIFANLVLATENPIDQEGTYPLPEAQVDRFMLKLKIDYPAREEERQILDLMARTTNLPSAIAVVESQQILSARQVINDIYVDDKVKDYIVDLVCATREPQEYRIDLKDFILMGASPRATISLTLAAKAYAFLKGRGYVTPQDVKSIGMDVLRHRIAITYEAEAEEKTSETIIQKIFDELPVP